MVKGVQKKIIEVNHPDSLYFERAVFYLKPGVTQLPQQLSPCGCRCPAPGGCAGQGGKTVLAAYRPAGAA